MTPKTPGSIAAKNDGKTRVNRGGAPGGMAGIAKPM